MEGGIGWNGMAGVVDNTPAIPRHLSPRRRGECHRFDGDDLRRLCLGDHLSRWTHDWASWRLDQRCQILLGEILWSLGRKRLSGQTLCD